MAHAAFQWDDPFLLSQQLTDDERAGSGAGRGQSTQFLAEAMSSLSVIGSGKLFERGVGLPRF